VNFSHVVNSKVMLVSPLPKRLRFSLVWKLSQGAVLGIGYLFLALGYLGHFGAMICVWMGNLWKCIVLKTLS